MDDYIHFKLRFDIHPNHFQDYNILLDWLTNRYGILHKYTYGSEVSYKKKKPHWHLHVALKNTKNVKISKTPLNQIFKTWYHKNHPDGPKIFSNGYSLKYEKTLESEDKFFAYPLKEQKSDLISFGFTETNLLKLHTIGKTLLENKLEYIKKKELKQELCNTTWNKIVNYIDAHFHTSSNPSPLIETCDDDGLPFPFPRVIPLHINEYVRIIGTLLVQYYSEYEDDNIPWNLDSKVIKYSSQKRYLSPQLIYNLQTRFK